MRQLLFTFPLRSALMEFYAHSAFRMFPALYAFATGNDAARTTFEAAFVTEDQFAVIIVIQVGRTCHD